MVFGNIRFLWAFGLRVLVPSWLSARASLGPPQHGHLLQACKLRRQERAYVRDVEVTILHDLITGVMGHHFGQFLLVRSKSHFAPSLKGIRGCPVSGYESRRQQSS